MYDGLTGQPLAGLIARREALIGESNKLSAELRSAKTNKAQRRKSDECGCAKAEQGAGYEAICKKCNG